MIHYDYYADVPAAVIDELVHASPLGRFVTVGPSATPHLGLYPFTFSGDIVEMHLHKDDEQIADLRSNASCLFEVDEILGSIPSYWLHPENAVFATAYHRTVAFECTATLSESGTTLARQQNEIMARYQPEGKYRPVQADDPMYAGMIGMLVAVRLVITSTKVKFKVGQNRTFEQRAKIIAGLRARNRGSDAKAADALQWTVDLGWTTDGRPGAS